MGLRKPKRIHHNGKTVAAILEAHGLFFQGKDGGARADLTGADISGADLRNVNLRGANVNGAKFTGADLGVAILRETDLSGADLTGVDLSTTLMPKGWTQAAKQKNA